jgi:ferritin-like metal-binding protein YciE
MTEVRFVTIKNITMADNTRLISTLHQLLDYDARKFTSAEIQLKKSLEDWINKAGSMQLKIVLQKYHAFVQQHVQKMESFFEEEAINSLSFNNRIMQAFIEESNEKINSCADPEVKDACLLSCIQAINHYKISIYGTAAAFAKELDMEKFASVFHESEVNEKQIDDRLSQLAEHEINLKAKTVISLPAE